MSTNNAINKKSGGITLMPSGTNPGETGEIRFQELAANGNNHVAIKAPDSLDDSSTYTLPAALPTGNRVLQSDATGKLSWVSAGGGGGGGSLEDLSDVTITNPQPGEALRYDGSEWKNQVIPAAVSPQVLQFYGSGAPDTAYYKIKDFWGGISTFRIPSSSPGISLDTIFEGDNRYYPVRKRRSVTSIFKIYEDNTLWAQGQNYHGQLGIGSATGNDSPVTAWTKVNDDTDWKEVFASYCAPEVTFAIKNDGTLWSWGFNGNGATGHGATSGNTVTPTQIGSDDDWLEVIPVTTGTFHHGNNQFGSTSVVALKTDGTLWSWGSNASGLTGQGTTSGNTLTPTQIGVDNDWVAVEPFSAWTTNTNASVVACYIALKSDGTLWSWGANTNYMTGLGTNSGSTSVPTQIGTDSDWAKIVPMCGGHNSIGRNNISGTGAGLAVTQYALKDNGEVHGWGTQIRGSTTPTLYPLTTPTRIWSDNDTKVSDIFIAYRGGTDLSYFLPVGRPFFYSSTINFNNPASGGVLNIPSLQSKIPISRPDYGFSATPFVAIITE